ncbi:MAG TPA: F0F1 ATP synthase subunit delta [Methylomirabilota bacterium]|nr:F0F1 ATP synthase subunit delta [Methylomirabilota bacterium]
MKSSKLTRREAKELFRAATVNGRMDDNKIRAAFQQLAEKKPRGYVAIMAHMQRLVKLDIAKRTATIESPVELTPETRKDLEAKLASSYGPNLILNYKLNPSLIGGLRIQVGSDVYDGSVRARLNAIEAAA